MDNDGSEIKEHTADLVGMFLVLLSCQKSCINRGQGRVPSNRTPGSGGAPTSACWGLTLLAYSVLALPKCGYMMFLLA